METVSTQCDSLSFASRAPLQDRQSHISRKLLIWGASLSTLCTCCFEASQQPRQPAHVRPCQLFLFHASVDTAAQNGTPTGSVWGRGPEAERGCGGHRAERAGHAAATLQTRAHWSQAARTQGAWRLSVDRRQQHHASDTLFSQVTCPERPPLEPAAWKSQVPAVTQEPQVLMSKCHQVWKLQAPAGFRESQVPDT